MNHNILNNYLSGKQVAILGFGKEGRSTYAVIRKMMPDFPLVICDQSDNQEMRNTCFLKSDRHTRCFFGPHYLEGLQGVDLVIKSPGISFKMLRGLPEHIRITSQTEIFMDLFGKQVTGITGTKGKSTTSSLLYHILQLSGIKTVLAGNIGVPPLNLLPRIDKDTHVVFEMSSHQLEHLKNSPHVAILLNIYQEHLDHYQSYEKYQQAKMNIARWQHPGDFFICNTTDEIIASNLRQMDVPGQVISLENPSETNFHARFVENHLHVSLPKGKHIIKDLGMNRKLPGEHNLLNVAAACTAALLAGAPAQCIQHGVATFKGLPHRLEFVGKVAGVDYYNDSIATIPEAAIQAVKSWPNTQTLILGGFDRGVDYAPFMKFLESSGVKNLVFMGEAGKRMCDFINTPGFSSKTIIMAPDLQQAFQWAVKNTQPGNVCLLSPAAASYDVFRNFEERGEMFRALVQQAGE